MIRALVIDLDGTLINRSERISPRVSRAMAAVSEKIQVAIATGREPAHVMDFAGQLALTGPQICDGGANILDPVSGETLWRVPLLPDHAQLIVERLDRMEAAFIATYPGGSITSKAQVPHWNLTRVSALDLAPETADALVSVLGAVPDLRVVKVYLPYNDMWAVDFTHGSVDKATAVLKLGEIIGVEPSRMAAAGDSYNDLPLLEVCGLRIAMGDAPVELKAIAHYVAPSAEDDGLAVAIDDFLLPRMLENQDHR